MIFSTWSDINSAGPLRQFLHCPHIFLGLILLYFWLSPQINAFLLFLLSHPPSTIEISPESQGLMELSEKPDKKNDHDWRVDFLRVGIGDAIKGIRGNMKEKKVRNEDDASSWPCDPALSFKKMNSKNCLLTTSRVIYILTSDLTTIYR